jgi:hypothetical protein
MSEPLNFKSRAIPVTAMQVIDLEAMNDVVAWVRDAGGEAWAIPRLNVETGQDIPAVQVRCPDKSRRNANLGSWVVFGFGGGFLVYTDEFFTDNFDSVM